MFFCSKRFYRLNIPTLGNSLVHNHDARVASENVRVHGTGTFMSQNGHRVSLDNSGYRVNSPIHFIGLCFPYLRSCTGQALTTAELAHDVKEII